MKHAVISSNLIEALKEPDERARRETSEEEATTKEETLPASGTGKFTKGTSGNPGGRPKGALGKATLVKQALEAEAEGILLKNASKVIQAVVQQAKKGCTKSQKLIWDSVIPKKRSLELTSSGKKDNIIKINIETLVTGNDKHEEPLDGEFIEVKPDEE